MKFKELFNEDMTPNWKKILSVKEFSILKTIKDGEDSVFDHTKRAVEHMADELELLSIPSTDDGYTALMTAALCHDIGKKTASIDSESGINGSNICRRLFYDETVFNREKVCFMVKSLPDMWTMFDQDMAIRTMIRLSWGHASVNDMKLLYKCDFLAGEGVGAGYDLGERIEKIDKFSGDIKCRHKRYDFDNISQKNEFFYRIPDNAYKKGKRFTVYFMVGLPGAGKDTYISKRLHGIPTVCRDDIRTEIGIGGVKPQGTKKEEDMVTKIVNDRIVDFCEKRTSFIINNTNLKKEYRDAFERMVLPYKPKIVFVYIEAPSVSVNKDRRSGQIPPNIIEKMSRNFDFPEPYEYDEIRYDLQK